MRSGLPAVQPSGAGNRVPALFYRAFEDRHRGPRELIKSRQRVYLPFIAPLLSIDSDAKAIDLGCGRGEWLELLQDAGFDAQGVDLDDSMLAACRELGLNVVTADALAALKALPDESQCVVSGFHIAEHIPFSDLQILVQEALRVLKPAGLLILETPNPENMVVGTVSFYLDPSHQKPIPPELLSFLPEYYGFAKVKVVRLQEDPALWGKAWISLRDVVAGVSPDYAVISQKSAAAALLSLNHDAFAQDYGVTLDALANRFDQQTEQVTQVQAQTLKTQESAAQAQAQTLQAQESAAQAQAQALQAQESAAQAQAQTLQAQESAAQAQAQALQAQESAAQAQAQTLQAQESAAQAQAQTLQAQESAAQAQAQALQAQESAVQAQALLNQMAISRSWRITAPLRWLATQLRQTGLMHLPRKLLRKASVGPKLLLQHAALYVRGRPWLKNAAWKALNRLPRLKRWLFQAITVPVLHQNLSMPIAHLNPRMQQNLSPRARQIYADLKTAIAQRQKKHD
jgi:SAM-dependent methyltransferase